jgi:hypothetical protein
MKPPRDVRVGESASLGVGWLDCGCGCGASKKSPAALCRPMMREIKRAALR